MTLNGNASSHGVTSTDARGPLGRFHRQTRDRYIHNQVLRDLHEPYRHRRITREVGRSEIISLRRRAVAITVIRGDSCPHDPPPSVILAVLGLFQDHLETLRPDVLLTYDGDPITQGMIDMAHRRGIPVVFAIHSFAYTSHPGQPETQKHENKTTVICVDLQTPRRPTGVGSPLDAEFAEGGPFPCGPWERA